MAAAFEVPRAERVRPKSLPARRGRPREFLAALESASRDLDDPVAKLRYIRESLARYEGIERAVGSMPAATLRHWLYRWLSLEGLRSRPGTTLGSGASRYVLVSRAVGLTFALVVPASLATGAYLALRADPARAAAAPAVAAAGAPTSVAPAIVSPRGLAPQGVWLVEQGEGFEQYSNGLRIDTSRVVAGEPRRFRTFSAKTGAMGAVREAPEGLLFHTSESDVWPLEASFNENLRDSSQRLLRYLRRNHLYHYLIDRFGRVFRVVEEGAKANHAGHSVWARGDEVYLSLNNAFLGICFETQWAGGRALPITQAQFAAGRNLTDYLRAKYSIAPELCVAHGLTSVNPKKHLIGHHLDWSRGFPFEAYGLPDQYARPTPSVALFGFGYDEHFIAQLGEPWPGVVAAEGELARAAAAAGRSVQALRSERQARYATWFDAQSRDEEQATKLAAGAPRVHGPTRRSPQVTGPVPERTGG